MDATREPANEPDGETLPDERPPPDGPRHRIGGEGGRIATGELTPVADLRTTLTTLHPGKRIVLGSRRHPASGLLTVEDVLSDGDGNTRWILCDTSGSPREIRDHPSFGRPQVLERDGRYGFVPWADGELWTLFVVAGETGPEVK